MTLAHHPIEITMMGVRGKQAQKVHETTTRKRHIMAGETNETVTDDTNETTEETTEETGTGINWAKVSVRDPHGAIDAAATLALCNEELTAHIADNEVDMREIDEAVAKVFVKLVSTPNGVSQKGLIDLQGLAGRAFNILDNEGEVPYGAETRLQDRIKDFVRGESETFVNTKGQAGKYHIKRGKDGGVRLASQAYVKEYLELQAKKAAAVAK